MGVNRNILNLAIPSILANITVPIVGMVDIAVAGHLDAGTAFPVATLIGGVAIGSMLFDLLYWNFAFLRVGTGGLTAQAFGRGDFRDAANIFSRAVGISLLCSLVLIAIQWIFVKGAFLVVDCTPEVRELATRYFFIRIWAAPATLGLMAFKGWFIGMQDSVNPMITDLIVNAMNVIMSIALALGFTLGGWHYDGMGFSGIALGTVLAQYSGLLYAWAVVLVRYRRKVFDGYGLGDFFRAFRGPETSAFFRMNTDLFVRSLCFIGIYIGFTTFSAHYGDVLLASGTILMKILMIFSYFTDGFAYAGEALVGRFIGDRNRKMMVKTVKYIFMWSLSIGVVFTFVYWFGGTPLLHVMTNDAEVVEMSRRFMPWLIVMPVIGCAAFTWDGVYIGAIATKTIRNTMIWAAAGFFLTYYAGLMLLDIMNVGENYPVIAFHILLAAYFLIFDTLKG